MVPLSPPLPDSMDFGSRCALGPSRGWVSTSRLEKAIGKGHRRPLWTSMTQSLHGRWQEGVDIAALPAKHPQGWRQVQDGESTHLVPGGHQRPPGAAVMKQGFRPKRRWDDPAASRSSSRGPSAAHHRHLQLDHPCHIAKDTPDCLGLQELWKPFGTGKYKNKQDFCFRNSVFRASWDVPGADWGI